ncbi:MAG: phosphomannomutase [Rhodobacteraceae bacterium]|nr:phosphomannomutase [Paracoccaceae bacterium]
MAPKFGTSGLRGLVSELTGDLCSAYTRAFLQVTPHGGQLFIGRDLRPSSPLITRSVAMAASAMGLRVVDCGALPTPALALAAMKAGAPAIMVTGSHIPADRNGLKFYTGTGEITKHDEAAITAALTALPDMPRKMGPAPTESGATDDYLDRYRTYFPRAALQGLRIGNYQHSSVARDLTSQILSDLGAAVVDLARSDRFIPVDTEAVAPETRADLTRWSRDHRLDAVVSTDGDGDRPLLTDETGTVIPGDILGVLTARWVGADTVVTPVSSNSMVERIGLFATHRTRIGSPYVIAGMDEAGAKRVVGFEANGGFLLGFRAEDEGRAIAPLLTRDSFLPILAPLAAAAKAGMPLSALVADLPQRRTASDRLEGVQTDWSLGFVAGLAAAPDRRAEFFVAQGSETAIDLTDGLRVTFASGDIIHLRPSGNAPEFRCYAECDTAEAAERLVKETLERVQRIRNG